MDELSMAADAISDSELAGMYWLYYVFVDNGNDDDDNDDNNDNVNGDNNDDDDDDFQKHHPHIISYYTGAAIRGQVMSNCRRMYVFWVISTPIGVIRICIGSY